MDEVDGLIVLVEVMDVMVVVLNVNKEIECIWLYVREIVPRMTFSKVC